jgi:hypothetical protein
MKNTVKSQNMQKKTRNKEITDKDTNKKRD